MVIDTTRPQPVLYAHASSLLGKLVTARLWSIFARRLGSDPAWRDRSIFPVERRGSSALFRSRAADGAYGCLGPRLDHAGLDLGAADRRVRALLSRGGLRSARAGRIRNRRNRLRARTTRAGYRRANRADGATLCAASRLVAR